jgi:thiol-disulfide isomerase/thioredoxin
MLHRLAISTLVALSLLAAPTAAQDDKETQFAAAMQQGDKAIALRQFEDALKAFKRASGLRDKRSAEAHFGMARAYNGLSAPKSAADACTEALKFVGGNTSLEASIRNVRGLAMFDLAEKNDDKRLKDAEADFRAVVELTDAIPIAHYNLGFALLRQGRDDDGIQALNVFLAKAPNLREAAEARRLIENPRRARVLFAPEFSISTLQGEHIALEDLRGRVVLVDFWATWCGPCVKATPGLQRLAKKFATEPFTLLAISLDRNQEAWKRYVAEHKMDWPQYLDNGRVAALFKVKPIPTYILIDHEGIVRGTETGYGSNTDGWLDSEIKKLLKEAKKSTTSSDGGGE